MKRFEPNLLLAISTAFSLLLVLMTTSLFGAPGVWLRNVLMAIICAGGFILLNPILLRMMKITPRPPMIHPDSPGSAVWAGLFPAVVLAAAAVPVFFPGHDYGLLVIIASIWFAVTIESALKAARAR
ncbi:MAG: hypothetical protein EON86_13345 [Brevundimonas sp.]|nr:MAG: hypothetical protein EON86_13345 [Brevundimonas sp.]